MLANHLGPQGEERQEAVIDSSLEQMLLSTTKSVESSQGLAGALKSSGGETDDLQDVTKSNEALGMKTGVKEEDALRTIKICSNVERKKYEVLRQLEHHMRVVDLKISLYITACNNVRLKPFPSHIVEDSEEGLQGLMLLNDMIPPVDVLKRFLVWRHPLTPTDQVVNLVHWLTVQLPQPKLFEMSSEDFDSVYQNVEGAFNLQTPTYAYKVMVNNLSSNHLQWQAARGSLSTKFAFYSVRVEHLHSLIHLGLYPFEKKDGPLGRGIYLTTDLGSCLDTSSSSWVWGKSQLGTQLQTIAVVEFIAGHPQVSAFRDKNWPRTGTILGKPNHFYVPQTNLMQVRYILIFVKDAHKMPQEAIQLLASRKELKDTWRRIFLLSSYLALCFVSWKSGKNSDTGISYFLLEKLRNIPYLKPLTLFIQPPKNF